MKKLKKILVVALVSLSLVCSALFAVACGEQPHVHALLKVEAKQATCLEDGNIEHYACKDCGKLFTDANGKNEISASEIKTTTTAHGHLTKTEANAATCVAAGNIAYWTCDVCGKTFSDGNATTEVTLAATVTSINASSHTHLTKTEAAAATCSDVGNIDYWTCDDCGKIYSDENATAEVTLAATVTAINASAHSHLIKTGAQAATCVSAGNSDYWSCIGCKKVYSDENGTTETTVEAMTAEINPANHSHLTKTEAKAATCVEAGNTAYWTCDGCGKIYSDEEATAETTLAATVIAIDADAHGEVISHEAKEASCVEAGNSAYYSCSLCEKKYSDEACEHEVTDVEIPVSDTHTGTIESHDAVEATCETPGNIAYWTCTVCHKYYSDAACTDEIGDITIPVLTVHNSAIYHDSVAATCSDEGNIEYWYCPVCEKYFSTDPTVSRATETTLEGTVTAIDSENHVHLTATGAKAATCIATGNIAYWTCDDCHTVFSDAAGKQPTTLEGTVEAINPNAHGTTTEHAAKEATCKEAGNIAHYTCNLCEKNFAEATCENEVTDAVIPVLTTHEHLTKTERIEATCAAVGNIEYWTCDVCDKLFTSNPGTPATLITSGQTVIAINPDAHGATEHHEAEPANCKDAGIIEYWTCTLCHKNYSDAECKNEVDSIVDPVNNNHGTVAAGTLEKTERVEAKCNAEGNIEYYTCTVCGKLFEDEACTNQVTDVVLPTTAHHLEKTEEVPFQCTEDGTEAYWTCADCGTMFSDEDGTTQIDAPIAIPAHHVTTHYDEAEPTWGIDGHIDHWQCTACEKYFNDEAATEELSEEQVIVARTATPVIVPVGYGEYNPNNVFNPHGNYEYINVYRKEYIRNNGATVYNFWSPTNANDKDGWKTVGTSGYKGKTTVKIQGTNIIPEEQAVPTLITEPDTKAEWLQFNGDAARFQLFYIRDTYTGGTKSAQLFGKTLVEEMYGFRFLYTFSISADGGYTLILADNGSGASLSDVKGFGFTFDGNKVSYLYGKNILATATLRNAANNFKFDDGKPHDIAFEIKRIDGTYATIALYVDGYLVKFENTAAADGVTQTTVTENGTFSVNVQTSGCGLHMAFIAHHPTDTEYTTLKIHDLDIRYDGAPDTNPPAASEPEEVATEAKNNYLDEAEEQNTDGND